MSGVVSQSGIDGGGGVEMETEAVHRIQGELTSSTESGCVSVCVGCLILNLTV